MSTDIVRHQGNTVALVDDHYLNRIPRLAEQLARSDMCPDSFKEKPDEIAIVGYALADNGIRLSISTLPQCYVVHGRPGYSAQIQSAMAAMHGVTIRPVGSKCDEESATVEVILPDRSRHEVTFTMKEAQKAGLTADKKTKQGGTIPSMYKTWAANMLVARATTRAIGWYCPAVKLGLAGSVNMDELEVLDAEEVGDEPAETGELVAFAEAGSQLVAAFLAQGYDRETARGHARWTWQLAGLQSGDSVTRTRLDEMLALVPEAPSKNPTQKDGDDSPDGTGIPAPIEDGEAAQARSHDPGGADESGIEPSVAQVSGDRRDDSASAASGPGAACEVVTPEVIPPGVHDDAPEAAGLFDAEDEGRPF